VTAIVALGLVTIVLGVATLDVPEQAGAATSRT